MGHDRRDKHSFDRCRHNRNELELDGRRPGRYRISSDGSSGNHEGHGMGHSGGDRGNDRV